MTLPSHRTREFPNNTPSFFKVQLVHLLDFSPDGWQVALSSITLPRAQLNLKPLELGVTNHVAMATMIPMQLDDGTKNVRFTEVMMSEQKAGHERVQFGDGVDYLKSLLALMESKLSQSLKEKDQITKWIQFNWQGEGELVADGMLGTAVDFDLHWCELMGWVKRVKQGEGEQDTFEVGPQAIPMNRETSAGVLTRPKDSFMGGDELIAIETRRNQHLITFSTKSQVAFHQPQCHVQASGRPPFVHPVGLLQCGGQRLGGQ